MELTSDIILKGPIWANTIDHLKDAFERPAFDIFILSLTIGIMYDKRIASMDNENGETKTVPRTIILAHDNGKFDTCLQAAILSTTTVNYSEDERLQIAFGDENTFPDNEKYRKIDFLVEFANFGVTKLYELLDDEIIQTLDNIKDFLVSSVEDRNLEALGIDDDIFFED